MSDLARGTPDAEAPGRERQRLFVVTAAGRAAIAAAVEADPALRPAELRVTMAVVALTALWCRLSDEVSLAELGSRAGIGGSVATRSKEAGRALRHLVELGIVTYEPGDGRGRVSRVGLPVLVTQRGGRGTPPSNDNLGLADAERGGPATPPSTEKGGVISAVKGGSWHPPTQESQEIPPLPPRGGGSATPKRNPPGLAPRRWRPPDPRDAAGAAQRAIAERHMAELAAAPPRDPDALARLRAVRAKPP